MKNINVGIQAAAIHKGSSKKLAETYAYVCGVWAPENHIELKNEPSIEIYINDPNTTPEIDLLTKIMVPIKK